MGCPCDAAGGGGWVAFPCGIASRRCKCALLPLAAWRDAPGRGSHGIALPCGGACAQVWDIGSCSWPRGHGIDESFTACS